MAIKRLHYFDHQFLVEADFTDEQKYHLEMRRRLNRALHTFGIAEGLEVVKKTNNIVTVKPGVAIDHLGREIVIETDQDVPLGAFTTAVPVFITIAYQERETDPSNATDVSGNTRFTEEPLLQAVAGTPPIGGSVIQLARINLTAGGGVPGNVNDAFDGGVRQAAGPKGERGLTSINNVKSPGGNVDLAAGDGIAITPDQTNRLITIAASGAQGPVSLNGVRNPGGNIDLVTILGQAIVITPDDAANKITIGENHSAQTGNVHGLTAANLQQIGALLATQYDLRRRGMATVRFTDLDADGATRTMTVGFQPKLVLVFEAHRVRSTTPKEIHGGGGGAFAFLDEGPPPRVVQHCFGLEMDRLTTSDLDYSIIGGGHICATALIYPGAGGVLGGTLTVSITNFTDDGLVVKLAKVPARPNAAGSFVFDIALSMICLG